MTKQKLLLSADGEGTILDRSRESSTQAGSGGGRNQERAEWIWSILLAKSKSFSVTPPSL